MPKPNCRVDGCPNEASCKRLCKTHYGRLWRHGDVRADVPVIPRRANTEAEFWNRVDKNGPTNPARPDLGPCWMWTYALNSGGYGQFGYKDNQREGAHRVSWMMANQRDVPEGTELDHVCHTLDDSCPGGAESCPHRRCVNPAHLDPVPHRENSLRGVRGNMDTCPEGHELQVLTVRNGHPKRYCPICAKARQAAIAAECVGDRPGRSPRRSPTPELLAEVAQVYRSALDSGVRPRLAVARHFQKAPHSVSQWIAKAREAGYLPARG